MTDPAFKRGDLVEKHGGRYGGPGRIVGETDDLSDDGYRLYAVAMKVEGGYGEFVHVFPESVLRLVAHANPSVWKRGEDVEVCLGAPDRKADQRVWLKAKIVQDAGARVTVKFSDGSGVTVRRAQVRPRAML